MTIINTPADLEAIAGSPEHAAFMAALKGSLSRRVDCAGYPPGYGSSQYAGPEVEPVWQIIEDTSLVTRFGLDPAIFAS